MKNIHPRAFALLEVLVLVALLAGGLFMAKPGLFPGASKRATQSTQSTAALTKAEDANGAAAAASVAKIGEVAATLPPSQARDFLGREVPFALNLLPSPDPLKLLEAERRRAAVMEGRAAEAEKLYAAGAKENAELRKALEQALEARRRVDVDLEVAAAAEHARTMQLVGAGLVVTLLAAGWIWTRTHSIAPEILGRIRADVSAGMSTVRAMDTHLAPRFHAVVKRAAQLATELKEPPPEARPAPSA